MADEQEAIAPATEQAPPAIETEANEPELIPEPGEELGTESEQEVLDVVEVEWDDGRKYQIPKALEGGLLRNKDYTQKTQKVAERDKALTTRESEIEARAKATDDELDARADLRALDRQLAEYAKLTPQDWQAHSDTDPKGTGDAWRHYQWLQIQKAELEKKLGTAQTQRTEKAQQDLAKRWQETEAFAQKEIPGWKPELTDTLVKFALDEGVPKDLLQANWSPVLYKLLHQANVGKKALQQPAAKALPQPPPAPLATVGGKSTPIARGDLASANMEDYVAMRKKGVGGKAFG